MSRRATLDVVLYMECRAKVAGQTSGPKGAHPETLIGAHAKPWPPLAGHMYKPSQMREPPGYQWHPPTPQYVLEVPGEGV